MRAFPYLRVSGSTQVDGDGFPRQKEAINKFAIDNSLTVHAWAQEEGVSGTVEALDRPAFGELLETIESVRQHDKETTGSSEYCIVVERMDRLARDLMVQELLLRECRSRGIKVYSVDQGLMDVASNDGDPSRKLIRQILGAVAEWEKSTLVKKLYAARQRTGRWGGAQAYGKLNPTEARVKAAILEWHRIGKGYGEITKLLNMSGETNRLGRPWTRTGVRDVITGRKQHARK